MVRMVGCMGIICAPVLVFGTNRHSMIQHVYPDDNLLLTWPLRSSLHNFAALCQLQALQCAP